MLYNKKKQKTTIDKQFQDEIKEVKGLLNQGKAMVERATSQANYRQALEVLTKAIQKIATIQVANTYLLYYYRGICYMRLKQLAKAERDFVEGLGLADDKGRVQLYNSLGKCKVEMAAQDSSYFDQAIKNFEKANQLSKNSDGDAYMSLGNIYKVLGNYYQAIKEYTNSFKYLKSNEYKYDIHLNRGLCYRQIGDIQKSTRDFVNASQLKKTEPLPYFNLGVNYLRIEKYEQALQNLQYAIQINAEQPCFFNYKGLVLYQTNQPETALTTFKQAIRLHQHKGSKGEQFAEALYNSGNCYLKLNQLVEAIQAFQMSQQLSYGQQLVLKITYSLGLAYQKQNNTIVSIKQFRKCIQLINQNRENDLYLSSLYHLAKNLHLRKQYNEALQCLSTIQTKGCNDKCIYELSGRIHIDAEIYNDALTDFQTLLQIDQNDPKVYYYLGVSKTCLGDLDSAIADFLKAMQLGSRDIQILNGISCAYLKAGKPDKALVYANITLEKQPKNQKFLIQRAMVYIQLGQYHKSIQDLTNAITLNSWNPISYYQRGISNYKSKQFKLAIKDLNKSFQLKPSKTIQHQIHYLIGVSHSNLQQFEQAVQPFTKAIELKRVPKYYHERAKCYLLLQRNNQALIDLNEVISQQENNAFAYFRRALAHKALKQYQESAQNFMKARQLSPDDPKMMVNKKQIYEIKYRKLCEAGEEM